MLLENIFKKVVDIQYRYDIIRVFNKEEHNMGLDMYLYLRKYESQYSKNFKAQRFYPTELKEFKDKIKKRNYLSRETYFQVGYWRKANAIHDWIVQKCADGEDKCQKIYVSIEQLKELLDNVNKVLDNHSLASELLPTASGFFFGSTDYDEWYYEDLTYTKELLESVLAFIKNNYEYDAVYQASW
jgi:DNA repair ATPase RecN